jgi:hypothetical protein
METMLYTMKTMNLGKLKKEFLMLTAFHGHKFCDEINSLQGVDDTVKEGSLKIRVETKDSLRARTGVSPDLADAAFLALEMARARFGLVAVEPPAKETVKADSEGVFALFVGQTARSPIRSLRDLDIVSRTAHAHIDINA